MRNVDIALALFQSITEDELDAVSSHFAVDAEWTEIPLGLTYRGPAGWRENVEYWRKSMDDGAVEVTKVIDGGDTVVVEYTGGGTNTRPTSTPEGEIPPTGTRLVAQFVDVWEFENGKIVRGRAYVGGLMAQLHASTAAATGATD
jgi:ketosteroid isomerase-like protein